MKIGVVDVDTSHPEGWIPIEREMGHEVVAIWDGGSVHPVGHAQQFADRFGIPRVFERMEDMVEHVDCAIIHGCDWDLHIDKARPFVEAGKSVLIDKPLAGNVRDLEQLREWARQGAKITGGSSLRFCYESQRWLAQPVGERGTPHTVLAGCAVDEFNYGIHAYSLLAGLMGSGATSVRHLGEHVQRRVQVNWPDGRMGLVVVGKAEAWVPFYASIATEKLAAQFVTDNSLLYRALLEAVLPYLAGEKDDPPVPMDELVEAELCAIAARQSWMNGDVEVMLADLPQDAPGYDGAAFATGYRAMRYPGPGAAAR